MGLALYLTVWREHFWNTVANKENLQFIHQIIIFTGVALCMCFLSGISGYLISLTSIKWRECLNATALDRNNNEHALENMNQRIQEDCMSYPDLYLNLTFGTIKSIIYVIVFSISLIISFSWTFLGVLLAYSILGTLVTKYIAKPLISLNYQQQRLEASYRNNLTIENFADCIHIMLGLAKKQKHLTYFQQFYGQIGVIVPLLIIAPAYFTSGMTIGMLMRFNSISTTILDNMSYGINSFVMINKLISCKKRLKEADII